MRCPCCDEILTEIKIDKRDNTVRPCPVCQQIIDETVHDFYKKDDPDAIIVDDDFELSEDSDASSLANLSDVSLRGEDDDDYDE